MRSKPKIVSRDEVRRANYTKKKEEKKSGILSIFQ